MLFQLNGEIKNILNSILKEKLTGVFASLIHGPYAGGYADEKTAIDVLVIIESGSRKTVLSSLSEQIAGRKARFLAVSRKTFEEDVREEKIGGIIAENLLTPYDPIIGIDYLEEQETKFKKKMISDVLANLVLSFPEMSRNFLIKPEYFLFESMIRRAALFPLVSYRFLNVTTGDKSERNIALIMRGFRAAINELISEDVLEVTDGDFLRISEKYITAMRRQRVYRMKNLFSTLRSCIIRNVLGVFSDIRESLLDEYRIYRIKHAGGKILNNPLRNLEDPGKYIFVPTAFGITPFSEKTSIEGFIRKYMPKEQASVHRIKKLGGVLNSVYILKFLGDNNVEKKVIVKVFKDWYGWKWFPLALWTLGTKSFVVLGKNRLEREYAMNKFLSDHGVDVPKIFYVNPREKIIFQEYINGVTASRIIRRLYGRIGEEERKRLLTIIGEIGRQIAKIHNLGVSIGDCKPENVLLSADGGIFFVDLEQAERGGDQAWDIAEFLYYPSHHILLPPLSVVKEVAKAFINGYIESGGKVDNVRRIMSPKYIKVFSFFTPPHILLTIANSCKEALEVWEERLRGNSGGLQNGN